MSSNYDWIDEYLKGTPEPPKEEAEPAAAEPGEQSPAEAPNSFETPVGPVSADDTILAAEFSGETAFPEPDGRVPSDPSVGEIFPEAEGPAAAADFAEAEAPASEAAGVHNPDGSTDWRNYYYASGPIETARPARNYRPVYTEQPAAQPVKAETKAEKRRSGGFWKKAVALALVCTLLGGAAGVGGAFLVNQLSSKGGSAASPSGGTSVQVAAPRESTELSVVTVDSGKLMTASQVYKTNVNSTVGITTEITTTNWWGYQSTAAAAGSGFILTEDGYILTNEHVIEKANTITVAMYDGTKYAATLVGYDTNNDIAVLKIDAKGLTPVTLGDSDALEVGDEVVAIGNPLGELTFSLTKGNVSALNRAVTLSSSVTMKLIQTDAAINSGNSGGALFNMYGEVVGITNAKYSSSGYSSEASIDNIGFAIPINSVREIVTSIIEKGYISTPYIGVSVGNVSEESQSYGMPQGAAIRSVEQGSPAEQAGLQANDIVTAIDGETITGFEDLKERIKASQPGDQLTFSVYRKGETITINVTIGEKTQSALPNQQSQQSGQSGYPGQEGQSGGYPGQDGQSGMPGQDGQSSMPGQDEQGQFPWGNGSNGGDDGSENSSGGFPWG